MTDTNDGMIKKSKPKVSIIIPVYNTEEYLGECLKSVVNQTYKNLDIILIDDGSNDMSGSICDSFAESDPRIRVVHGVNQGRSIARNIGLDLMCGNYFTFVDADDILIDDAIEALINASEESTDIVFGRVRDFYPDNGELCSDESGNVTDITHEEMLEIFFLDGMHGDLGHYDIYNGPVARLYSEKYKNVRFAEDLSYAEDYLYSVKVLQKCGKIRYLDKVLYQYRRFYDEDNHFWEKFRLLSLEAVEARKRALTYVKENEDSIYNDFLLRSYYTILEIYSSCIRHGYEESAEKIAAELDRIKTDVKKGRSYRNLRLVSKMKLMISFVSYKLYDRITS